MGDITSIIDIRNAICHCMCALSSAFIGMAVLSVLCFYKSNALKKKYQYFTLNQESLIITFVFFSVCVD